MRTWSNESYPSLRLRISHRLNRNSSSNVDGGVLRVRVNVFSTLSVVKSHESRPISALQFQGSAKVIEANTESTSVRRSIICRRSRWWIAAQCTVEIGIEVTK